MYGVLKLTTVIGQSPVISSE